MFPYTITHIRAALIRAADLLVRLVSLEALALPDAWFHQPADEAPRRARDARRPGAVAPRPGLCAWDWPPAPAGGVPARQPAPGPCTSGGLRPPRNGALAPASASAVASATLQTPARRRTARRRAAERHACPSARTTPQRSSLRD